MTRNTTADTNTADTDTDTDTAPVIARFAFGSADGDRIYGLADTITFRAAVGPRNGKPATPAAFVFRAPTAFGKSLRRKSAPDTALASVSVTDAATVAAMLATFGVDSIAPTAAMLDASPEYRTFRTALTAAGDAITPIVVALPGRPVVTLDDATRDALIAAAAAAAD